MEDPIIFLDIDGVLNTTAQIDRVIAWAEEAGRSPGTTADALASLIDPSRVEHLNEIVAATGAKVVASTDWRQMVDVETLSRILNQQGFRGELIDETPHTPGPRGDQIQAWLDAHPEVGNFIALDDDEEMTTVRHRAVETSNKTGLTDEHVQRAIALLRED